MIEPVMFRYSSEPGGYLNIEVRFSDVPETLASIDEAWKKIDKIHPMDAAFYDDQIQRSYNQFVVMVKVIGSIAILAICIASIGLFGMVVFTTETRLKEISIRKVCGALEVSLVYILSREFLLLLLLSAVIALPLTYLLFDKLILINFAYHQPLGWIDLLAGAFGIGMIALLMIASQTWKAARSNPAEILKSE
jgi:ABC-type antimicrobial peptide transport system permease subunit